MILSTTLALCCTFWVSTLPAQQNQGATLTTQASGDGINIKLAWNAPVRTSYYKDKNQLHMQFSKALGQADLTRLSVCCSAWLLNVQYGYDSLLLVLTPEAGANVTRTETEVTVHLIRIFSNTPSPPPEDSDDQLNYLRAVSSLHAGDSHKARAILVQLSDKTPSNMAYLKSLALSEYRLGDWRAAYRHYDRVLSLDPEQKDIKQVKYQLIREHGGQLKFDSMMRMADNNKNQQKLIRIHANTLLSMDWRLSGTLSRREIHFDKTTHHPSIASLTLRDDVELSLSYYHQMQEQQLTLLSNESSIGVRFQLANGFLAHQNGLLIAINEPVPEYIEGIAQPWKRHRFQLNFKRQYNKKVSSSLDILTRHYYHRREKIADTAGFRGWLRYTLRTYRPTLAVAYAIDGEYTIKQHAPVKTPNRKNQSASGLRIRNHEVHTLRLELAHTFNHSLYLSTAGGYILDRYQGKAPFINIGLRYAINKLFQVGFVLTNTLSFEQKTTNSEVREITIYMVGYFI